MSISARCPHCLTLFQLNDSLDGKKVRCKNCKETFAVTVAPPAASPISPFQDEKDQEREALARRRRDDRYEDDFPVPKPAPAIPQKYLILGGAIALGGLLFIILLVAGISSMDSVEKKTATVTPLPPPPDIIIAPAPTSQPATTTPKYGPEQTVTLRVSDLRDDVTRRMLEQKLNDAADAAPAVLESKPEGQVQVIKLAPVRDADALAKKIAAFATVLGVKDRTVQVSAQSLSLAANPPAAGSIKPQITTALEAPSEADERPAQLPPPALWQLKPDPQAETVKLSPKTKPVPFPGAQRLIYPSTPSIYAAAGGGGVGVGAIVQLYNLQALKMGKRLQIPTGLGEPTALSPDGVYIAGKAGPAAGAQAALIDIWSFSTGKRAANIPIPEGSRAQLELLDFAQPGQLLVMKSELGKRNVQVWDIEKGELLREWIGPSTYQPHSAALSPGRKYLAVGEKEKLWVYDVATGQVAAEADLSGPTKPFFKYECHGLAFSPDGAELAGIFETPFKSRLISWDVAKGEVVADHTFDKRLHWHYKGPPVEWLPDRSALLVYGRNLVEHQTGKLVYEVPNMGPGTDRQIRVVGSDTLLEVVHNFQGALLAVSALPKAQLDQAIEATRKAWAALSLPPAEARDLSAARVIPVSDGVAWSVTPGAPAMPADRFVSRPIPLLQRETDVQRVLFTRPEAAVAGVLNAVTPNQVFAKKVLRLERYDLARGVPLGGTNLCIDPQYRFGEGVPSDLNGDGTVLALKGRQDPRRVDVWSVAEGKHLAAWLPYASEAGTAAPGIAKADQVTWLGLLGSDRLFTLNAAGKLVLWTLPDATPLYVLDKVVADSPVLSPAQNYLAVAQGSAYYLYEASSGTPVGMLDCPALTATTSGPASASAAFSPDGGLLAALANGTLTCWELKAGKQVANFPVDQGITGITWASGRYLIGRGPHRQALAYLIDIDQQVVLCSYRLPGSHSTVGSPDGRLWYLQNTPNQSFLAAQAVPDAAALNVEALMKDPATPALLRPGMAVAVRVTVDGNENARLQIAEALQKRVLAGGLTPADNAPITLNLRAAITTTGRNLNYQHMFGRGPEGDRSVSVPVQKLVVSATLGDARNTWWKQETTSETSQTFFEHIRQDEDLASRFENRLWQQGVTLASQLQVPNRVYLVNGQPLVLPVPLVLGGEGR